MRKIALLLAVLLSMSLIFTSCESKKRSSSSKGYWGSDGYYNPTDAEKAQTRKEVDEWMKNNW